MKQHLNTLFVFTPGAYLRKDSETVVVRIERQNKLRLPLLNLGAIVCFGRVTCSPFLLGACAERGIAVSFMTEQGRFLAAVNGFTPGNVLLRREQYRRADDLTASAEIARACIIGKLANYRTVLRRAVRDQTASPATERLEGVATRLDTTLRCLNPSMNLDQLRGVEGDATSEYFSVFNDLIVAQKEKFVFSGRNRRPPLDPVNAMLSFGYAMLTNDVRSACEASGLDAAVGFLHRDRPGRPSLALDLIEEFRPVLVDRLVLSLINRQQVKPSGFQVDPGGGIRMDETTRREIVAAYQKRKLEEIVHPFLGEKMTLGLVPHIQARLFARHLRGDSDAYPPFNWK
ncbi:MAG: type I-C CRISPR-associated endonuclease Cas1 [Planctomycetaceae bacterium]|nr:type I-C CRISPR-associated endonuclease Cas1 [Planctomycetaceae bacterium]